MIDYLRPFKFSILKSTWKFDFSKSHIFSKDLLSSYRVKGIFSPSVYFMSLGPLTVIISFCRRESCSVYPLKLCNRSLIL